MKVNKRLKLSREVKAIAKVVFVFGILAAIWYFFAGYMFNNSWVIYSWFLNNVWTALLFPGGWNLLHATPLFWILLSSSIVAIVGVSMKRKGHGRNRSLEENGLKVLGIGLLASCAVSVVAVVVFGGLLQGYWTASFYNKSNVYKVESLQNLPSSLERVASSSRSQVNIETGVMNTEWENRSASATGAAYVMRKTGDTIQNTSLIPSTISYIDSGDTAGWTAIRNGERRTGVYGITTWAGAGERVDTCTFSGENELNYAFGGSYGTNLSDRVSRFAPSFVWSMSDMYGYCDRGIPTIVIPGTELVANRVQASLVPAGVITIKGSQSGEPVFEWIENVESGDLPGGVYPTSILRSQHKALSWSAGRVWPWGIPTGFTKASQCAEEAGTIEEQKELGENCNSGELLLRSKEDGRLYWVTPMKPLNAESDTVSAYSIVQADEVHRGQMNENSIYVLNETDENIVNFNDLENAVTQAVSKIDPGFFTGNKDNLGSIVEFVPTSKGSWRVFAERGGRAVYEIHLSGGQLMKTSLKALSDEGEVISPSVKDFNEFSDEVTDFDCNTPQDLSDQELSECLSIFTEELSTRLSDSNN